MPIYQITGSNGVLPATYNSIKLTLEAQFFPNIGNTNQTIYKTYPLRFYYYYNSNLQNIPAYRNAIWIKLNDNVWLYINVSNLQNKKVSIYSSANLNLDNYPQIRSTSYKLPFGFNGPNAFVEDNTDVENITAVQLLDRIIERLDCILNK